MADEKESILIYNIAEPSKRDIGDIVTLHNSVLNSRATYRYYEDILRIIYNPFWIAYDKSNREIIGFIAAKVKKEASTVYVASIAVEKEIQGIGIEKSLLKRVLSSAKKLGAKYISMHCRKSSKKTRKILKKLDFIETDAGKYKDGEKKFLLTYTFEDIEEKPIVIPHKKYKKRKKVRAKKKPIKGQFEIRESTYKDISQVLALHNEHMVRQREFSYFSYLNNKKNKLFYVAIDSNDDVAGYIACRPERKKGIKVGPNTRINFVSMTVGSEYRGWGIAKTLINKMFNEVSSRKNIEYIYGHVRGKNIAARNLYKKIGFRERRIGKYEDDGDSKYLIIKRFRIPAIMPYLIQYQDYIKWFSVGIIGHELIHLVRDYEE